MMMTTDARLIADSPSQSSSPQNTHIKATVMRLFHPAPQAFLCFLATRNIPCDQLGDSPELWHHSSRGSSNGPWRNCGAFVRDPYICEGRQTNGCRKCHVTRDLNEIFMLVVSRTSQRTHQWTLLDFFRCDFYVSNLWSVITQVTLTGRDKSWLQMSFTCCMKGSNWTTSTTTTMYLQVSSLTTSHASATLSVTLMWMLFSCLVIY